MNRLSALRLKVLLTGSASLAAALLPALSASAAPSDPATDTLNISRYLKPIPDDQWAEIAGTRKSENYDIQSGDTLSGISGRLFGDPRYWPKIWAINQQGITNPHVISPGNAIIFNPGSGTALPSVGVQSAAENAALAKADPTAEPPPISSTIPRRKGQSQEWRNLPKQRWEEYTAPPVQETDLTGLDKKRRGNRFKITGDDAVFRVYSEEPPILGVIQSANVGISSVTQHYIVMVKSDDAAALSVDTEYSLVRNIQSVPGQSGDGYAVRSLGTIKIVEKFEEGFKGVISRADLEIQRGDKLIALIPQHPFVQPAPAPQALADQTTRVILPERYAVAGIAQNLYAFIDFGSVDGVQPGMIFRTYQTKDPRTNDDHISPYTYDQGDFIVVQTSERHSVVRGYHTNSMIEADTPIRALTDLSLLHGVKHGIVQTRTLDIDEVDAKPDASSDANAPTPTASEIPTAPSEELPATDLSATDSSLEFPSDSTFDSALDSTLDGDLAPPSEESLLDAPSE